MVSAGRKSSANDMSTRPRKSRRRQTVAFVVCVENSSTLLHWNYTRSTESPSIKTWRGRATFASLTRAARTICTRRNGSRA